MKIFMLELFANIQTMAIISDQNIEAVAMNLGNLIAIVIIRVAFLGCELLIKKLRQKKQQL